MKRWMMISLVACVSTAMGVACGGEHEGGPGGESATLANASGDIGVLLDTPEEKNFLINTINDEEADIWFCYEDGECEGEGEFSTGGLGTEPKLMSAADPERQPVGVSVAVNIGNGTDDGAEAEMLVAEGEYDPEGFGQGDFEIDREFHRTEPHGPDDEKIVFDYGDVSELE